MGDLDGLDRIARAYQLNVEEIRDQVTAYGREVWASLPNYRDAAIDRMVSTIIPRVQAGQLQTARLTDAYLAACARELGYRLNVPALDEGDVLGGRGVAPDVVYQRPATTVYTDLSKGSDLSQAARMGGLRLVQIIGGDLEIAKRNRAHRVMRSGSTFQYYRRIPTGRETCGLCTIAATQRYKVADLMPIHPGCDCDQGPLPRDVAWDQVIDQDALDAAHSAVEAHAGSSDRSGRTPDYRKLLLNSEGGSLTVRDLEDVEVEVVKVREHGEYGPVLTWAHQSFTGPTDLR